MLYIPDSYIQNEERENYVSIASSCDTMSETGAVRCCTRCTSEKALQWRTTMCGPKTLCKACGVRLKLGQLVSGIIRWRIGGVDLPLLFDGALVLLLLDLLWNDMFYGRKFIVPTMRLSFITMHLNIIPKIKPKTKAQNVSWFCHDETFQLSNNLSIESNFISSMFLFSSFPFRKSSSC